MSKIKKTFSDFCEDIRNFALTIIVVSTLVSGIGMIAWKTWASPVIEKKIETKTDPVIENLKYLNFLMMSTLSETQLKWANEKYEESKKHSID